MVAKEDGPAAEQPRALCCCQPGLPSLSTASAGPQRQAKHLLHLPLRSFHSPPSSKRIVTARYCHLCLHTTRHTTSLCLESFDCVADVCITVRHAAGPFQAVRAFSSSPFLDVLEICGGCGVHGGCGGHNEFVVTATIVETSAAITRFAAKQMRERTEVEQPEQVNHLGFDICD